MKRLFLLLGLAVRMVDEAVLLGWRSTSTRTLAWVHSTPFTPTSDQTHLYAAAIRPPVVCARVTMLEIQLSLYSLKQSIALAFMP